MTSSNPVSGDQLEVKVTASSRKKLKVGILIRRIHLYAGLFLLPWVFLYGITGAMYNHQWLLPDAEFTSVGSEKLKGTSLDNFPDAESLARDVVSKLQAAAPDKTISLSQHASAQFNNDVILEVREGQQKYAVHIDPISKSAHVSKLPKQEALQPMLQDVTSVQLDQNPYSIAKGSVSEIMRQAGYGDGGSVHPRGWCKLNFIADVDGIPARVTYVLRDEHVDITKFDGRDGMLPRGFFLRLHTTHGQPPHWNARMIWSIFLDTMAIAMVTWGVTGLVMWWQLKRTRLIGFAVILTSVLTASCLYFAMSDFYASTKL